MFTNSKGGLKTVADPPTDVATMTKSPPSKVILKEAPSVSKIVDSTMDFHSPFGSHITVADILL